MRWRTHRSRTDPTRTRAPCAASAAGALIGLGVGLVTGVGLGVVLFGGAAATVIGIAVAVTAAGALVGAALGGIWGHEQSRACEDTFEAPHTGEAVLQ